MIKHEWVKDRTTDELLEESNRAYVELRDAEARVRAIRREIYMRRHAEYVARAQELDGSLSIDISEFIRATKPVCPDCQGFVTPGALQHSIIMSSDSPVVEFRCGLGIDY